MRVYMNNAAPSLAHLETSGSCLHAQVVIASTRPGRVGSAVAEWFLGRALAHGAFEIGVTDLAKLALPFLDEPNHPSLRRYTRDHTKRWSATVDAADAFVFVMPEYNHGFNAPLKNAIDFLYQEWQYKPVGFVSYGGVSGGTRAVQMIKQVITTLKMIPLNEAVPIPFVATLLNADGKLEPNELMELGATKMLDELYRLAGAMSSFRKSVSAG